MRFKVFLSGIFIGMGIIFLPGWGGTIRIRPTTLVDQNKQDSLKSESFFGMRLRPLPKKINDIYEPVIVKNSPANEATVLRLTNGKIKIFFINRPGPADKLMSISSRDNGITWTKPKKEFDLPGAAYYANNVIEDEKDNLHCVFHVFGKGENGYHGRHLDLWYCHTKNQGKDWSKPKKIFDGYVGSIRGFIELNNKRLLLTFAKAVSSRTQKPNNLNVDYGWNEIISLYSDDKGKTWQTSDNSIKIAVDSNKTTRYGGIEPSIIELKSGKIWMLIRTNKGYLYQSFSDDAGRTWQSPEPTKLISSDSPATILRLSDNRILLFWCGDQRWDDRNSYANGGREVLHAAISSDEGRIWKGFREVLTDPCEKSALKGDRGTAYSSAIETSKGKVLLVTGQGEGRSVVMFDPNWLEQPMAYDNFSDGLAQWTLFGADGLTRLEHVAAAKKYKALLIRKSDTQSNEDTQGVWNFPMTEKGSLNMEIMMNPKNKGVSLALTNHFSVSNDKKASTEAPVYFSLKENIMDSVTTLLKVVILWDIHQGKASMLVNGKFKEEKYFRRQAPFGINYLRVGIPGIAGDSAGYIIKSVKVVPQRVL